MGYQEECFLESLISILIYKRHSNAEPMFLATNAQIARIAALRNPTQLRSWDNQQIERLKRKYVTRRGKPASVFELVQEVQKGGRKRGAKVGTPSEYRPTGILLFLAPVAPSPSPQVGHPHAHSSKP